MQGKASRFTFHFKSYVTRHTSHVTRHTSHVTRHRPGTTFTITLPAMKRLGAVHSMQLRLEGNCSGSVEFTTVFLKQNTASQEDDIEMRAVGGGNVVLSAKAAGLLARNEGVSSRRLFCFLYFRRLLLLLLLLLLLHHHHHHDHHHHHHHHHVLLNAIHRYSRCCPL